MPGGSLWHGTKKRKYLGVDNFSGGHANIPKKFRGLPLPSQGVKLKKFFQSSAVSAAVPLQWSSLLLHNQGSQEPRRTPENDVDSAFPSLCSNPGQYLHERLPVAKMTT